MRPLPCHLTTLGPLSSILATSALFFACAEAKAPATPMQVATVAPTETATLQVPIPIASDADDARQAELGVLAALDRGDFDGARQACDAALARFPHRASLTALRDTTEKLADKARSRALEGTRPLVLPTPPFGYSLRRALSGTGSPPPSLRKLEEKKNRITDEEAWLKRNNLALPTWEVANPFRQIAGNVPRDIPERYNGHLLVEAIDLHDQAILVYGRDFGSGRFVAVIDTSHRPVALFDFGAFLTPPKARAQDASFVGGMVQWAVVRDNVLYVSTGHRTYAASSFGKNAFISAIDLATGELLWQSDPLVSNAANFLLMGDYIISGYGFTAEPDFLFVLDRTNGKIVKRIPVKSGPEYIIERDGQLFVRTYDTDYVFALSGGPPQRPTSP